MLNLISRAFYKTNNVLIPLFLIFLSSCSDKTPATPQKAEKYTIKGNILYIPQAYTSFNFTGVDERAVLLQAWYPGSAPVPGRPDDLWREGSWDKKNVGILIDFPPKPNPVAVMKGQIDLHKASKKMEDIYGLEHYSQFDEHRGLNNDIFIDSVAEGSFISCPKKIDEKYPVVQICKHYIGIKNASITISYNKELLPEWKMIKQNVLDMYQSFESSQTASTYISQFYKSNDK